MVVRQASHPERRARDEGRPGPARTAGAEVGARRAALAEQLGDDDRLRAELRIEDTIGNVSVVADLKLRELRTSIEYPAPEEGYP
ncbi:hypothetical protein [Kitasatospora paranensis]|uniref:Uncharacterized protein n=1 Tax=Kitasatospora paranensis TaxID=258053 RepID=A0ABW2G3I7_9ACTN